MKRLLLLSKHLNIEHKNRLCESLGKKPQDIKIAFSENSAELYKEKPFVEESKKELIEFGFKLENFDLKEFNNKPNELENYLKNFDTTYFSGGNVTYLNFLFNKLNLSEKYINLVEAGKIIHIGSSAGAIICENNMFVGYYLDSDYPAPEGLNRGLGLIKEFHISPHYSNKPKYTKLYADVIKYNINKGEPVIPLTNDQGIWYEDGDWEII